MVTGPTGRSSTPAGGFTLLLGGVRSGKSSTAERMAASGGLPVAVIATAEALDEEMAERIARHRAGRPAGWLTIEEPLTLAGAVSSAGEDRFVVVDCLTLWVANLLGAGRADGEVLTAAEEFARQLAGRAAPAVVVSNEVGMGVHPSSDLGRRYRDVLGAVNTIVATHARRTALLVAGRALLLGDPLAVCTVDGWDAA